MRALILVDLQNDFLAGGPLEVPDGDQVIPVANRVARAFELVVATRDWHPPNHGSFARVHPGKEPGDVIELNGLKQTLWPVHCVQETSGAQFAAAFDTDAVQRVFDKGTDPGVDSYSGFFDNGRRNATGLDRYLHNRDVDEVYICGLALDVCVRATALDAADLGFRTFVIEDGTRAVNLNPQDGANAASDMRRAGVVFVRSTEI